MLKNAMLVPNFQSDYISGKLIHMNFVFIPMKCDLFVQLPFLYLS